MPNYRRARTVGATYFFTVVAYRRQPILCDEAGPSCLENCNRVGPRNSAVHRRCLGAAAGSHALHLELTARRRGLRYALEPD